MPTERFFRLPDKKKEAVRSGGKGVCPGASGGSVY